MWRKTLGILWLLLFVWAAVLGFRHGSLRWVIMPLFGMACLYIAQDYITKRYPSFSGRLNVTLVGLLFIYNAVFTLWPVFVMQLPWTADALIGQMNRRDLQTAIGLDPGPPLKAQQALARYRAQVVDAEATAISSGLDKLIAKRKMGTFGPADVKAEQELLARYQRLAQQSDELKRIITLGPVSPGTLLPSPEATSAPQSQGGTPPSPLGDALEDKAVFIDELTNGSSGNAFGISWTQGIGEHGAVFSAASASRIEYPGRILGEGTVEVWIKVDSGYQYQDYAFRKDLDDAMIFSTDAEGGDVTWPGTTKFFVSRNGSVSLFVAKNRYNNPPTSPLEAPGTRFRFGEWHAIGFSMGSLGESIMVDGKVVAVDRSRTQAIGCAGTHQTPADVPTLGETASHFWPHHRYEGGFEGTVAKFRVSAKQRDWHLARRIGD